MKINVLAELEAFGIAYDYASDVEVKFLCPFHDDSSPSLFLNVKKAQFKCQTAGCEAHGDMTALIQKWMKTDRKTVGVYLQRKYGLANVKAIDRSVVERHHAAIWSAGPLLAELYARAVTDDDIRKYRLGVDDGRITIPIFDAAGNCINLRRYLPGAPGAEKMKNTKGFGYMSLYPIEQLQYDRVMLCGGEMKAIVAARQLNPHGIGAVCATAGEGNWSQTLLDQLTGKLMYVCLDIDAAGKAASAQRCVQLRGRCTSYLVELPLDPKVHPKGDINDFVAAGGDLYPLVESAEEYKVEQAVNPDAEPEDTTLNEAITASMALRRVRINAVVAAMDTTPYIIPKDVQVVCARDQRVCGFCPVWSDDKPRTVPPESSALLQMVGTSKAIQQEALDEAIGIPQACRAHAFNVLEFYNVEDTRLSPQLSISNHTSDRSMLPAVCIGRGLELNEQYRLTGKLLPHPKTQQSTLLISGYETSQDALSTFKLVDPKPLEIFKPRSWTVGGVAERLDEIYSDLEANVTRIFRRRDIHLFADLTYHSPLLLTFDGKDDVKGWSETLVIGDSAQGKSETVINLQKHYGLGEKVECKGASAAGLLGGLQQMGTRWFVSWGVLPTHDRRLVILEELKGTSPEVIAKLTDMRSSGIAHLSKIEKRKTHARTRIIALSNPRSDFPLSSYNFGIEAIKELIGSLEDIRRFDAILLVSANDINARELNDLQRLRPQIVHKFTGELCRQLILWGWTLTPDRVVFQPSAFEACLDHATALSSRFASEIPIVDSGSMKLKLARLAAALAVRTFSYEAGKLIVRPCHVEYVYDTLLRVYSSKTFGYEDFTKAIRITQTLIDPEQIEGALHRTPHPRDFCTHILHKNFIDPNDLADWTGLPRDDVQRLLSLLVRKNALLRAGRAYRKSSPFIELLKKIIPDLKESHDEF